jgi:tRNA A37 threonylcarbamoyladenosine dehydratase
MREITEPASEGHQQRFHKTRLLFGNSDVEILRRAHVCVAGIGGVGSWAVEALARTGVGELTLIDMDSICITNSNRQIHANAETLGRRKAEVMAERVKMINPEIKVNVIDDFLTPENIKDYISKEFDFVLDAIDRIYSKAALIAYCKSNKIKIITSGGAGGQLDPTLVNVKDLSRTIHDPLAKKVRDILRHQYNFSKNPERKFGVDCVFSTEQVKYAPFDKETGEPQGFGTALATTGTFGFTAASRIIKKILDKHRVK